MIDAVKNLIAEVEAYADGYHFVVNLKGLLRAGRVESWSVTMSRTLVWQDLKVVSTEAYFESLKYLPKWLVRHDGGNSGHIHITGTRHLRRKSMARSESLARFS